MGRPRKPDAGVPLSLRIKPAASDWLDATSAEYGIDRTELARQLMSKGLAAWRAGWRPLGIRLEPGRDT